MKIEPKAIAIKDLYKGYKDNDEMGVIAYSGKLDIRPPYQREFVYDEKDSAAVIHSVINKYPLNSIYWSVNGKNKFEVIDGQQRILSICKFCEGDFSYKGKYFHSLTSDQQDKFNQYELNVYLCSGTDSDRLAWFETINIAGKELTAQELKNATFSGTWVTDAKRYFSKRNCVAFNKAAYYLKGEAIRQHYLETAIKWISKGEIKDYMSKHQHDNNATNLWSYFSKVIDWLEKTFPKKRPFMKGIEWGFLYNKFKDKKYKSNLLEKAISELIKFEENIKLSGIYEFILTGEEKYLSVRKFSNLIKTKVYEKQKGKCKVCNEHFDISEMEADHIKAWFDNGKTDEDNCQMLCRPHHYDKTAEQTRMLRAKLKIS